MDDIAYMAATQEEKYALVKAEAKRLQEKLSKPLSSNRKPREAWVSGYKKPEGCKGWEVTQHTLPEDTKQWFGEFYASREYQGD